MGIFLTERCWFVNDEFRCGARKKSMRNHRYTKKEAALKTRPLRASERSRLLRTPEC
jgi:hypothetical protein